MTEQRKIPLQGARPVEPGQSLLERASGAFGLDAMKPPALPPRPVREAQAQAPVPEPQTKPVAVPHATSAHKRVEFSARAIRIEREHLRENGLIVPEGPVSALMEEFRIVKRELLGDAHAAGTDAARRILVCSPHAGEGKTYCAVNLALAMAAEREIEVVLVDADFANPSVPRALGFEPGRGFMDALADSSIAPEALVLATDIKGLFVLPSGARTSNDAEYLTSARTRDVLDRLTAGAPNRYLVFDTPPALAASPAAELAKHVGQALLVARADVTGQRALEDASQLLSACPDIKLLLNAAQFSPSGRKFGAYGAYGN